ncbi:SPOR domain-containing protein [Marinomonas sp. C2222]|uniref:SPOR domain-containing protein n=1 Tax=Marinomonas sargassi TaxID=2984494 RepID=A0ABT2YRE1_9GAMM|nr:SPOR domain-containing protein [Marinomonas sargassi]MCV2402452.1 SPOR domain-containing protein [Marinomonas sargassi]
MMKNLILAAMGLSLVACSSTGEQNTFMAYGELQRKVRSHDEQWQSVQEKLDKIDALEAEIAELKKEKEEAWNNEQSAVEVAPSIYETTPPSVLDSESIQTQDSGLLEARTIAERGFAESETVMNEAPQALPQNQVTNAEEASSETGERTDPEPEYAVQIGAYRYKDEVVRGWQAFLKKDPDSFQTLQPLIDQKEVRGSTMYLLKAGPFINRSYSNDFCTGLKSKGTDCLVTEYKGESFTLN